jgi:hypothetical protein
MIRKQIEGLMWEVISPSHFRLVGDNREIVRCATGWALWRGGKLGPVFSTRSEAMRAVAYGWGFIELVRKGFRPGDPEMFELAARLIGFEFARQEHGQDAQRLRHG